MSSNILDLKGHIGLVTGAGQGVGRAVALHFANNGAGGVVVNDFLLARAEAVAVEVERAGCAALAVQSDVTEFASVSAMFDKARTNSEALTFSSTMPAMPAPTRAPSRASRSGSRSPRTGKRFWAPTCSGC